MCGASRDDDPLNGDLAAAVEVVIDAQGAIVRMGMVRSSGVAAFDVGALRSFEAAAPYSVPPSAVRSVDGNFYVHWTVHRDPDKACSTFFARPFTVER